MKRRAELDGIRFIGIAGVFGIHANGALPGGHLGVSVFFVLSGYLITSLLMNEVDREGRVDLRQFWVRRAARLFPALILVLAFYGPALLLFGEPADDVGLGVATSAFYFANIAVAYVSDTAMAPFAWSWTLSLEEQFYLVWPLALVGAWKRGWTRGLKLIAITLVGVAAVFRLSLPLGTSAESAHIYAGIETRMSGILLGCLLAMAIKGRRLLRPATATVLAGSALGVIGVSFLVGQLGTRLTYGFWIPAAEIATALLILGLTDNREGMVARVMSFTPTAHLGQISYGLYLWNIPIYHAVQHYLHGRTSPSVNGVVWIATTFVLAELSFRFVEEPVMRAVKARGREPIDQAVELPELGDGPVDRHEAETGASGVEHLDLLGDRSRSGRG